MKLRHTSHKLWITDVFGGGVIQLTFEVADGHPSGGTEIVDVTEVEDAAV